MSYQTPAQANLVRLAFNVWLLVLFSSLALPTGVLATIPYRMLLVLIALVLLMPFLWQKRQTLIADRNNWLLLAAGIFLLLNTIQGLANFPVAQVLDDLKLWLTLLLYLFLTNFFLRMEHNSAVTMFNAILAGLVIFMLYKTGFYGLSRFHPEAFRQIVEPFFTLTAYRPVMLPLDIGGLRINYINHDMLALAVVIIMYLRRQHYPRWFVAAAIALLIITQLIAFSRALLLLTAVFIAFVFIHQAYHRQQPCRVLWLLGTMALIAAALLFQPMLQIIEQRLFTPNLSDSIRSYTTEQLIKAIAQQPWQGYGLGAHIHGFTRSLNTPYSYEPQLLTFLLRFGVFTSIFIATALVLLIGYKARLAGRQSAILIVLFLATLTLLGLTNQYLLGAAASVFWVLILLICKGGLVQSGVKATSAP